MNRRGLLTVQVTLVAIAAALAAPVAADAGSRPANDNFQNALSLSGTAGTASGSNVNATLQGGEPVHAGVASGSSVWFSWRAPSAGTVTIDTFGSRFDTVLAAYTGSVVNALTAIAGNDNASGTQLSSITFTASAGVLYMIAVAGVKSGKNYAEGGATLHWSFTPPPPPANDNFASAQTIGGTSGSATGSNTWATLESGEPAHAGVTGGASVWYRWRAPADGSATVTTTGSAFDTVLAAYTGISVTALSSIAANNDANGTKQSQITFRATSGTTYNIAVAGYGSGAAAATGALSLNWSFVAASPPPPSTNPANDMFANAQAVTGGTGTVSGTNVAATLEAGEPNHANVPNGSSVWYAWQAPGNGTATISTAGSSFDTVLAVYAGTQISALTAIASNDDFNGTPQSQVSFNAVAGTTYRIAVAGFNNATAGVRTGSVTLNWSGPAATPAPSPTGPANDMFAGAQALSGPSGTVTGTNVGATLETGEPKHAGVANGASVWFSWQAAGSGATTVSTAGSSFDTVLAVYAGTQISALTAIASSDDFNGTPQSQVSFNAVAGTTYRIAVAGFDNATAGVRTGSLSLAWNGAAPSTTDTTPPTVALSAPAANSNARGIVQISATATDTGGIAKVELLVNGTVVATRTSSPYAADWDSTTATNGSVTMTARATDNNGNAATSAAATVTIQNTAPGPDPVLLAAGDIASCATTGDDATALLLGVPGATVATLGDAAFTSGTAADYASCYDPTWGAVKARTRPVIGNHDYDTAGAAGYFGYFGAAAGDPAKGYYSYDLAGWHVIVLNSNCAQVGGCAAGSPQKQWLQADLAAHPATCTVAMWHHPLVSSALYSDATSADVKPFWQDLYAAHADLILNAHAHIYERFAPQTPDGTADPANGIRQFTVATGGDSLNPLTATPPPNLEKNQNSTPGVLQLTLHAGGYDWQFLPIAGSTFTDSGTAACH